MDRERGNGDRSRGERPRRAPERQGGKGDHGDAPILELGPRLGDAAALAEVRASIRGSFRQVLVEGAGNRASAEQLVVETLTLERRVEALGGRSPGLAWVLRVEAAEGRVAAGLVRLGTGAPDLAEREFGQALERYKALLPAEAGEAPGPEPDEERGAVAQGYWSAAGLLGQALVDAAVRFGSNWKLQALPALVEEARQAFPGSPPANFELFLAAAHFGVALGDSGAAGRALTEAQTALSSRRGAHGPGRGPGGLDELGLLRASLDSGRLYLALGDVERSKGAESGPTLAETLYRLGASDFEAIRQRGFLALAYDGIASTWRDRAKAATNPDDARKATDTARRWARRAARLRSEL